MSFSRRPLTRLPRVRQAVNTVDRVYERPFLRPRVSYETGTIAIDWQGYAYGQTLLRGSLGTDSSIGFLQLFRSDGYFSLTQCADKLTVKCFEVQHVADHLRHYYVPKSVSSMTSMRTFLPPFCQPLRGTSINQHLADAARSYLETQSSCHQPTLTDSAIPCQIIQQSQGNPIPL